MRKKSRNYVVLVLIISVFVLMTGCSSSTQQESKESNSSQDIKETTQLPSLMTWSVYDTSGAGYIQASAIANALTTNEGVKIRTLPSGTSVGRMQPLQNKTATYGFLADETYFATEGLIEFAEKNWGPQDLRVVLQHPATIALAVTKESGIEKIQDLRGKRVAWIPGSATLNAKGEAMLAFGGLTWDDVVRVDMAGYAASLKGLNEGSVDAAVASPNASPLQELAASSKGVSYPQLPASDKEGWARLTKIAPWMFPTKEDLGAGMTKGQPLELGGYSYPQIVTYADTSADEVYNLIKAIDDNYASYKDADVLMPLWEIKISGKTPAGAPFHEGAIKYLKEKGVWTAEDDKWNEERLAEVKKLQELWSEAISEASSKGISDKDFPAFWAEKREAGLK